MLMANNSFYLNKGLVSPEVAILLKEHNFHEPCHWSLHGGYTSDKVITNHNKAKDFNGVEYAHNSTEWISVPYIQDVLSWLDNLGICTIRVLPMVYHGKVKFEFTVFSPVIDDKFGFQLSAMHLTRDDPHYEPHCYDTRREATNIAIKVALLKIKI